MISHDEIKDKAMAVIAEKRFRRYMIGGANVDVANNIAAAILDDHAHYRSTGIGERARQLMADRVRARVKLLNVSGPYGFDPLTMLIIGVLLNAIIRIIIDWYFDKQAEQARQEH